ncbi:class I SAM-dependent methyltransferase [Microseira wollei]|uniref:Methyltransferase n=1 Tax=Microseira wollei NIES-4236 TaxID=2530354 RepID=A0AAV3X5X0_9CYAN|nr:class I SAM-dependent methyltransferase [Microseira wollei]GET36000.1 methyltransferase [Microseira wollei NIES-4236]
MTSNLAQPEVTPSRYVTCNLCGSDDYTVLFESGVAQTNQIVKCNCCGLMYANPRAQEPDCVLIEQYDPDFVLSTIRGKYSWRNEKEALQVRDYETTKAYLRKNYPQKGLLVEVGSGLGYLLKFFKQDGWDVLGVEPNVGMCKYAERELGIKAIPTILEKAELPDESADAVLMMHVIEHVPNPLETLQEVYRILKPGGTFVLETPRYDTLMFKLLGKRERSLSCEGHIYFFTTNTLKTMASKAGFTVEKVDYVGRSLTVNRLFYNLGVIGKSQIVKRALESISKKLNLNKVWLEINLRDMQRFYLKKA